jgi:hypothetical protein
MSRFLLGHFKDTVNFKTDEDGDLTFLAESESVQLTNTANSSSMTLDFRNPLALFTPPRSSHPAMTAVIDRMLCDPLPVAKKQATGSRRSARLASRKSS